jgi:hypothetical protein
MRPRKPTSLHDLFHDRRKGSAFWLKFINFFAIFNWILAATILIMIDASLPKSETFFDRLFEVSAHTSWTIQNIEIITAMFCIIFLGSGISLVANTRYLKRDKDRLSLSNLFAFIFSWIAIFLYFGFF